MRRAFVHRKAPRGPAQFHVYLDKTPKRMKEKNPQGASFHRDVHPGNLMSLFKYFSPQWSHTAHSFHLIPNVQPL